MSRLERKGIVLLVILTLALILLSIAYADLEARADNKTNYIETLLKDNKTLVAENKDLQEQVNKYKEAYNKQLIENRDYKHLADVIENFENHVGMEMLRKQDYTNQMLEDMQ